MNFIPTDKHKFISRWGLSALAGFSACMGLLGAQNTLSHWDTLSQSETTTRVANQFTREQTKRRTEAELAQIEQRSQISDAFQRANVLDHSCGTTLSRFRYNPGTVDDDLIRWGINPQAPVFNPNPGRWHPIYAESGHLVAAIRNGSIITIDSKPSMSAGAMCTFGELTP
jgi:predicted membrane metal-binding protein